MTLPLRLLGTQGLQVPAMGLGCMGLSFAYTPYPSEEEGIALIKHAFEKGVAFFDTADIYGPFTNEVLLAKALKYLPREKVQLATKFGNVLLESGEMVVRGNREHVRKACEDSLKRLDVDYIDLYYQHRVDISVPIEETVRDIMIQMPHFDLKIRGSILLCLEGVVCFYFLSFHLSYSVEVCFVID